LTNIGVYDKSGVEMVDMTDKDPATIPTMRLLNYLFETAEENSAKSADDLAVLAIVEPRADQDFRGECEI
jgi:hypothetical protein